MTSQSRFWRAPVRPAEASNPLPGLVEMLLGLLLHDVPAGHSASLTVGRNGALWQVGEPAPAGPQVTASAPLADGELVTLAVQADLADDAPTQAQLQRFLRPMVVCLTLEQQLNAQRDQAREAVAAIERLAVVDLATGVVMARRDCDVQTARELLADWSASEGVDLQALTAADVLERLTADGS
jgi:hypothetical protein